MGKSRTGPALPYPTENPTGTELSKQSSDVLVEKLQTAAEHVTASFSSTKTKQNNTLTHSPSSMTMASPLQLQLHLHLLFFFILILSLLTLSTSKTLPSDIEALKSFKDSIDPSSIPQGSCLSSWDFSLDPCDASFSDHFTCGLRCDSSVNNLSRVTELALDPAGYSGPVSPSLWSLSLLQTLDLADNRFFGPFPSPSSPLPLLLRLSLSHNSLSGDLPDLSAAPSLQELYLDGNSFTGQLTLPAELTQLRRLELQGNNLTGAIPDLGALSSLAYLDASDNSLAGEFPANLPSSLVEITLRNNRLAGELAGLAIARLNSLQVLDLSHNSLSGAVPRSLFEHPTLEQVTLSSNGFLWMEPPGDGGIGSQLVAVDLGHNGLTGLLPDFIGSMPRLSAVDLADNQFRGMIPAQYAVRAVGPGRDGEAQFGRLVLSGNYLFGPIPGPMGRMKEGMGTVSLADNCLFRCPAVFFFCGGGEQKDSSTCREFNPVIP